MSRTKRYNELKETGWWLKACSTAKQYVEENNKWHDAHGWEREPEHVAIRFYSICGTDTGNWKRINKKGLKRHSRRNTRLNTRMECTRIRKAYDPDFHPEDLDWDKTPYYHYGWKDGHKEVCDDNEEPYFVSEEEAEIKTKYYSAYDYYEEVEYFDTYQNAREYDIHYDLENLSFDDTQTLMTKKLIWNYD